MLRDADKTKKEIIEWIQQYFEKKAPDCSAIIGISGGKDSSVAAALRAEAIGAERVIGVLMPNGKQEDILYARELTDYLNIPSMELNIGDTVEILGKTLEKNFELCKISGQKALTKETSINLPARVRMTVLYAVAQMMPQGARVVNTSNRSEDFVGYATKYGDSAGDFSPLSGILVHEVKQLGKALGLPEKFVEKTPSDGLSGMSDEDDDDKIRLNQRKPSKYKGLRRFGPEKNLQRINKFMKERPIFYKNLIQMKENIRFYLRCFYCITKVMILQFNSENRTELARNG